MNRKGIELDSNKCCGRCKGVDRISLLPDDVIVNILSLLPLMNAAATSVLSRRWSDLWKYSPNLNFVNHSIDDINIPIATPTPKQRDRVDRLLLSSLKNVAWVNTVLNSSRALSLKEFKISFFMHKECQGEISKWLSFAFSRRVEILNLDFEYAPCALDFEILSNIRSSDCRALRELTLKRLTVSGEAIELFMLNCPSLEQLIVQRATVTSDLVVAGCSLKHLEMDSNELGVVSIKVCAPNLSCLTYRYDVEKLFLENVPNLVQASFYLFGKEPMHNLANAAARLEILTISLLDPTVFSVPRMPKLKKFVLRYERANDDFLLPATCILQASPCLQEFRLKISDICRYYWNRPTGNAIFEVPKVGRLPHRHLKVFEFYGFCGQAADHMELVRYIVDTCVALREIVIVPLPPQAYSETDVPPWLAADYSGNPYMIKYPNRYDQDRLAASMQRDASLKIKKFTEQLLADIVPRHVELRLRD